MPNHQTHLDTVFKALADPTRRAVVARLSRGPVSMTDLAQPFRMALPSFAEHLDRLEACGLVRSVKVGRVRTYRLSTTPLRAVSRWLALASPAAGTVRPSSGPVRHVVAGPEERIGE